MTTVEKLFKESGLELTEDLLTLIENNNKKFKIPSKVEAKINYISEEELLTIHKDLITAKEIILSFLSMFKETYLMSKLSTGQEALGYKQFSSKILLDRLRIGTSNNYKQIIDLLIKYEIIEKGRSYKVGERNNEYRLTSTYFGKGIVDYQIKSKVILKRHNKLECVNLKKVLNCKIATNELLNRSLLKFPTNEEAREHLIKLESQGKTNKKGKRIRLKETVSPHDFGDYVFVEEYLIILDYLRQLTIPIVASENGGGRVITAFNFLPSTLRSLVTFNGESLGEVDYPCLHPNIVNTLYEGSGNTITHDNVADYLNISRQEAKVEHLSFFNKSWDQMIKSPLFEYYSEKEGGMMSRLYEEKKTMGYKLTSKKCFEIETEMQRETIDCLRDRGVTCFYVFDAIMVPKEDIKIVKEVMNKTAKKFNIKIKC